MQYIHVCAYFLKRTFDLFFLLLLLGLIFAIIYIKNNCLFLVIVLKKIFASFFKYRHYFFLFLKCLFIIFEICTVVCVLPLLLTLPTLIQSATTLVLQNTHTHTHSNILIT